MYKKIGFVYTLAYAIILYAFDFSTASSAPTRFETTPLLKKLASASRNLAELKGVAGTIPNQNMLINTLGMQEAKDSSEIENIVTTHDELFQEALSPTALTMPQPRKFYAIDRLSELVLRP